MRHFHLMLLCFSLYSVVLYFDNTSLTMLVSEAEVADGDFEEEVRNVLTHQ